MRMTTKRAYVILGVLCGLATTSAHGGQEQIDWLISQQNTNTWLVESYEGDGKSDAWIYDQALAIIAFTVGGETNRARCILDTMAALQLTNENEGAWHESYHFDNGSILEYTLNSGPIAWMVIAANYYEDSTADDSFGAMARAALAHLDAMSCSNLVDERFGAVGYSTDQPDVISTEHNLDAYAAYHGRAILDQSSWCRGRATQVRDYIRREMWAPSPLSNEPGVLTNAVVFWEGWMNFSFSTDLQSWGVLALGPYGPDGEAFSNALEWLWYDPYGNTRCTEDYSAVITNVDGFFSGMGEITNGQEEASEYIWVEGTEGVAAAFYLIGDTNRADHFHGEMNRTADGSGGLIHSFWDEDPGTNTWPRNWRYNCVHSTAWFYFNEMKVNPFFLVDSDSDRLSDAWETMWFSSLEQGESDDPDGDGLDNAGEQENFTDPTSWPTGIIEERRPTFSWLPTPGATWYRVWIGRRGRTYFSKWLHQTSTLWRPPFEIECGDYCWWIQSWGPADGLGVWDGPHCFLMPCCLPTAIAGMSPSNECIDTDDVTYAWDSDDCATWYQLWVNRDGSKWESKWYSTGAQTGSVSRIITGHPFGIYTWWIRGWGPDGMGPWSDGAEFAIGRALPVSPMGDVTSLVTFIWDDACSSQAEWYQIWVGGDSRTNIWVHKVDTSQCDPDPAKRCYEDISLPSGNYTWWIRAWKPGGLGPWSTGRNFTVQ